MLELKAIKNKFKNAALIRSSNYYKKHPHWISLEPKLPLLGVYAKEHNCNKMKKN